MIKGSNMTEMNSDYLAALRSWRNEKRNFTDDSSSIDRLRFREAMQRERDEQQSNKEQNSSNHSQDNIDDALSALQMLVEPNYANSGDINSLSALEMRGAGNTKTPPIQGATRHKVTITGAADSLSKAGLGSYQQESSSKTMDVSTGHSAKKTAGAVESMLMRLQRQQNTYARYRQVLKGYAIDSTITTDDADLWSVSHHETVRIMLMDAHLTKTVYKHIDKRMVKGVLR